MQGGAPGAALPVTPEQSLFPDETTMLAIDASTIRHSALATG